MKKRKLLETLKELIESNAKLSAENEELRTRIEQDDTQATPDETAHHTDEEYENLLADNRILSQKLMEAEAEIIKLSKPLEQADSAQSEEETALVSSPELTHNDDVAGTPLTQDSTEQNTDDAAEPIHISLDAIPSAELSGWQIDVASKIIGQSLIMITEFTNEISGSTSGNKRDLITLALGKSETFKAETVDAIAACKTPQEAETAGQKRLEELRSYINALRLSV